MFVSRDALKTVLAVPIPPRRTVLVALTLLPPCIGIGFKNFDDYEITIGVASWVGGLCVLLGIHIHQRVGQGVPTAKLWESEYHEQVNLRVGTSSVVDIASRALAVLKDAGRLQVDRDHRRAFTTVRSRFALSGFTAEIVIEDGTVPDESIATINIAPKSSFVIVDFGHCWRLGTDVANELARLAAENAHTATLRET